MSEAREKSRPQVVQMERGLEILLLPAVDELELLFGFRLLVRAGYADGGVVFVVVVVGAKA